MSELTARQKLFCDEYIKDFNGRQAAIRAGYSKNNAQISASSLLTLPNVQAYLAEKKAILAQKHEVTLDMIVEGYRRLAFFDSRKFYDENGKLKKVTELDDETMFALAGLDVSTVTTDYGARIDTNKVKMSDRNRALDSLCRVFGFNAPDKTALVSPDGSKPAQLMTDEQFKELLNAINK